MRCSLSSPLMETGWGGRGGGGISSRGAGSQHTAQGLEPHNRQSSVGTRASQASETQRWASSQDIRLGPRLPFLARIGEALGDGLLVCNLGGSCPASHCAGCAGSGERSHELLWDPGSPRGYQGTAASAALTRRPLVFLAAGTHHPCLCVVRHLRRFLKKGVG